MAQKYYMTSINKYGSPSKVDWKNKWVYVHINKVKVVAAHKLVMPPCFCEVEEKLEEIGEELQKLATQYKEIEISKYFASSYNKKRAL